MFRKILLLGWMTTLVFACFSPAQAAPVPQPNAAPNRFLDVSQRHWAVAWINQLYNEGVTGGCSTTPLKYCPDATVNRAQMAVFLGRVIHGSAHTPPAPANVFGDVPTTYWANAWINLLYTDGVTGGCSTNPLLFCPEAGVSRAQMAVFLLRATHGPSYTPPASGDVFTDVPANYWAHDWINQFYAEGFTGGCGTAPLRYCPDMLLNRAQMAVFLLRAIHGPTYSPPAIDLVGPTLGGCPLYPLNNVCNTPVDGLPVHARSAQWINSIGAGTGFHMDFGSGTWNNGKIGIPYNVVSGATVTKYTPVFLYADESDAGPYPLPANPLQEYGSDHHILTVDTDDCHLYELYAASFVSGNWHAGSGAIWDLNSNALRPDGWTSADAAGLPILPGLVRYDEIVDGVINHALRFTANSTNGYIWPARHLTSGTAGVLTSTPPMGARFRLKASYDISGFTPEMQIILQAMKTYGIILADNGSDWYISGAPDERWDNDMLHTLDVLTGADFEAVDESSLMVDPDSGQAQLPQGYWHPSVGQSIQIQYTGDLDTSFNTAIYNIDLFDATPEQIAALKGQGRKLMCYLNAGAWEDWRPDAASYPAAVLGNDYEGWPGEKWLDIRQIDTLAPILRARLDLCRSKGFDGVDPDNINGFTNNTGFPLSAQDQITFNTWLAGEAHARGLSIGMKNDSEQLTTLLPYFDWALIEDCYAQGWCADLAPFIAAGKPVFSVEYTDNGINMTQYCTQMASLGFTGIVKNRSLDAPLQACP
jgi:hypothetical protein